MRSPFFLSFRALLSLRRHLVQKSEASGFSPLNLLYGVVYCSHLSDPLKSGPLHSQQAQYWDQLHHMGVEIPAIHLLNPLLVLGFPETVGMGVSQFPPFTNYSPLLYAK